MSMSCGSSQRKNDGAKTIAICYMALAKRDGSDYEATVQDYEVVEEMDSWMGRYIQGHEHVFESKCEQHNPTYNIPSSSLARDGSTATLSPSPIETSKQPIPVWLVRLLWAIHYLLVWLAATSQSSSRLSHQSSVRSSIRSGSRWERHSIHSVSKNNYSARGSRKTII